MATDDFAGLAALDDLSTRSGWVGLSGTLRGRSSVGGMVESGPSGDVIYAYTALSPGPTQWAEVKYIQTSANGYLGPAVRVQDGAAWGAIIPGTGAGGTLYINRYAYGSWAGEAYTYTAPADGTVVRLAIQDIGSGNSRLRLFYDGALVWTQDVSTGPSDGNPGLAGYSQSGYVDDFDAGAYTTTGSGTADLACSYAIQSTGTADLAGSYAIASAGTSDLAGSYAVASAGSADLVCVYDVEAAVGSESSSLSCSYAIASAGTSDLAASYAIAVAGQADLAASFAIATGGNADLPCDYQIAASGTVDLSCSYSVASAGASDLLASYAILAAGSVDLSCGYAIRNAGYADLTCTFDIDGASGGGASPAAIWAHILPNGKTAAQTLIENNEMLRIIMAGIAGTSAGVGTDTETYFGTDGTTPRIVATFDSAGNRVAVATDGVA